MEIEGCGQFNTTKSALRIENVNINASTTTKKTAVHNSVIHNCRGNCLIIKKSKNISITNNVFFRSTEDMVSVNNLVSDFTFSSNLLVAVTKLDSDDDN